EKFGEPATQPSARPAVEITGWWDAFDDPVLNDIIDDAVRNNLDLRAATARLFEARVQRGVVAADWWPTVNVDGSYTRRRRTGSQSGVVGGTTGTGGTGNTGGVVIGGGNNRYSSLWDA